MPVQPAPPAWFGDDVSVHELAVRVWMPHPREGSADGLAREHLRKDRVRRERDQTASVLLPPRGLRRLPRGELGCHGVHLCVRALRCVRRVRRMRRVRCVQT